MATMVQQGEFIDYTPGSAVAAGDVVTIGDLVCVAPRAIAANEPGVLATEGVYDVDNGGSVAFTLGAKVFFNAGNPATSGGKFMGHAIRANGSGDATVRVRLASGGA